jgi:sirohydrochlorin cobaltochelatase
VTIALILAGHGSHISPNTAGVVWGYVDALRQQGVADEVTACFWKEQPYFHQVLQTVKSDNVVIVPMFTSTGYFSQQVIPAEMGFLGKGVGTASMLSDGNSKSSRKIYYTRTLGEHPYVGTIVKQRALDAMQHTGLVPDETAIVVIGHGTGRSSTTRQTTQHQVAILQESKIASHVVDAYLDDQPDIPSIYERTTASNLVVIPFFLAPGSHTTQDVPQALGMAYGDYPAQVNGREVYYTPPIGTDDVICDLILQLARDTGLPFVENPTGDVWGNFPQAGVEEFIAHVVLESNFIFGQLQISQQAVHPINSTQAVTLDNLSDLRQHVRGNPFRSLTTATDLSTDWIVPIEHIEQIPAVVETVYPGAIADWAANRQGILEIQPLAAVLQRQQGMFQSLANVDSGTVARYVNSVCGQCSRYPTWYEGQTPPDRIPCSAACNHWLASIKEDMNDG